MLSDTQDTTGRFPAACRFILLKQNWEPAESAPLPIDIKSELYEYAKTNTSFLSKNDLESNNSENLLKVIDSMSSIDARNILIMPQELIDLLTK